VPEAIDRDAVELAGQAFGAGGQSIVRNYERQDATRLEPAMDMIEKVQLHALVVEPANFYVIRRIQIQERTAFRRRVGVKHAAVDGGDAACGASGGAVRVQFNRRRVCRKALQNLQKSNALASAGIDGKELPFGGKEAPDVPRLLDW
jgi:hypothetical protein